MRQLPREEEAWQIRWKGGRERRDERKEEEEEEEGDPTSIFPFQMSAMYFSSVV